MVILSSAPLKVTFLYETYENFESVATLCQLHLAPPHSLRKFIDIFQEFYKDFLQILFWRNVGRNSSSNFCRNPRENFSSNSWRKIPKDLSGFIERIRERITMANLIPIVFLKNCQTKFFLNLEEFKTESLNGFLMESLAKFLNWISREMPKEILIQISEKKIYAKFEKWQITPIVISRKFRNQ